MPLRPTPWLLLLLVACAPDGGVKVYNTPPSVAITSPPDGSTYDEGQSVTVTGLVGDEQDSPQELSVLWTTNFDPEWSEAGAPDDAGNVNITLNFFTGGNWTITLGATDTNDDADNTTVGITVRSLEQLPSIAWVHPITGEGGVEGEPFAFEVLVSDPESAPGDLTVSLVSDVDGAFCTPLPDGGGHATCDDTLSVGEHTLTATVTDPDGNTAEDTVVYTVLAASAVDGDGDGWTGAQGDCDDADPSIYPGAEETENGVDDDCDGTVDEGTYGYDDDGDCACEAPTCTDSANDACTTLAGYDCDDADDTVYRGAPELCDDLDNDCDTEVDEGTVCTDDDGDGYSEGDLDCDDTNPAAYPGAPERLDGIDNDCDGLVDEGTGAYDDDGDCSCENSSCTGSVNASCTTLDPDDCDDADAAVSPAAAELCNGVDDDCDGSVDEGDAVGAATWYLDLDGDGYGDASRTMTACSAPVGYVAVAGDCNDAASAISPRATEACDGVDNDCDSLTDEAGATGEGDWYRDVDGDGYGDPAVTTTSCSAPLGYIADDADCDDRNESAYPGATEVCNGADDDCDGSVDEGGSLEEATWYRDADSDGFGSIDDTASGCVQPSGYVASANDCDDADAYISPAAAEVCDGLDDNCNGAVDESGAAGEALWYADDDEDTFGDPDTAALSCDAPRGYVADDTDCDDTASGVNPDADETCDGVDDNCDGAIDEPTAIDAAVWYVDADSDRYGSTAAYEVACTAPSGYTSNATDCNDASASIHPGATEVCDGVDQDCDGTADDGVRATWYRDADSDSYGSATVTSTACAAPVGYVADATDCNDAASSVHPGAAETCNSTDDDCDGAVDDSATDAVTWYRDGDGDGYGNSSSTVSACTAPSGYVANGTDCDDGARGVYPGATETCNGTDDDCDGAVDDGVTNTYWRDADGDGYGDSTVTTTGCSAPAGYVTNALDCNDASTAVKPGATETCNGIDDDCDSAVDEAGATGSTTWYVDADADGYGTTTSTTYTCTMPAGYAATATDCNDAASAVHPGATETCNGVDDNCSGTTDEGVTSTYYRDADSDGYGSSSVTAAACSAPSGYVTGSTDCNDAAASVHPGATETCNGVDDNCSGAIDEGVTSTYYRDADSDGYGSSSTTSAACSAPSGYVSNATDCNDASASVNPGVTEVVGDGIDENCTGGETCYVDADNDGYRNTTGTTVASADADCADSGEALSSEPATDCNDGSSSVHPGATETCNGVDDNCSGAADEGVTTTYYRDADGDGRGSTTVTTTGCSTPSGYVTNNSDCDDANASRYVGASEITGDNVDESCDGYEICYVDADNDGYRTTSGSTIASSDADCNDSGEAISTDPATDCNDAASGVHPGVAETCNSIDDNCSGAVDEGVTTTYYRDADGDTYGSSTVTSAACSLPSGYVTNSTDCQDANANVHPNQTTYYTTSYTTTSGGSSYDYNCNGAEEEYYAGGGICHVSGFGCSMTSGFIYSSSTPSCGSGGSYVTSCTWYGVYCDENTTATTQKCK